MCDDHASMVPAEGPFRQKVPVPFSRERDPRIVLTGRLALARRTWRRIAWSLGLTSWTAVSLALAAEGTVFNPNPQAQAQGDTQPSIGQRVGSAFKQGWDKVTGAVTPKPQVEPAIDATSLANKATPGPELRVAMGQLYERTGKFREAAEQFQAALAVSPNYVPALAGYAHLKVSCGELAQADALYRQVLAMAPGYVPALTGYARLKVRGRDLGAATGLYLEVRRLAPQEASVHNDLGLCYAQQRMFGQALAALEQAVRLQPKNPLYRNNLAMVLVDVDQFDAAYAQLRAVAPEAVAHYNLAFFLQKKGLTDDAARQFAWALKYDPSLAEARYWLDRIAAGRQGSMASGGTEAGAQPAPRFIAGDRATAYRQVEPGGAVIAPQPAACASPTGRGLRTRAGARPWIASLRISGARMPGSGWVDPSRAGGASVAPEPEMVRRQSAVDPAVPARGELAPLPPVHGSGSAPAETSPSTWRVQEPPGVVRLPAIGPAESPVRE